MDSMDPSYPAFPIFAFLSFLLVLIPLPWHLQAWNSGTCLFMIWTAVGCLNQFINSIVWHGNAIDWAPVWCDISTRLMVGISVAIPAASLCINRRLYMIATCQTVTITRAHKRRAVMVDLAIGLGIPALQLVLQFVVQGHRYDIFEDIGCYPTTVNTPAAYPLSFVWPNVICLISVIYCILTLRAFMMRRAQFSQFVSSNTSLSINRYFRLMCLATSEVFFTVPLSSYGLYLNITSRPIYPWKSWADIHYAWYVIDTYPGLLWRSSRVAVVTLELGRWSLILCALVFFVFFGFADEARKNYKRAYWAVVKRFGFVPPSADQKTSQLKGLVHPLKNNTNSILPVFVPQKSESAPTRRDSFHSTMSHASGHTSDDTATLYSPHTSSDKKVDFSQWPPTPTSSRLSRSTI
uniref:Pheromone receptor n=1 Tax=Agrocybe salicacicola TaxID=1078488 RepID=A0A2P0M875_9AGAR|nr:pheromone receptor [Agrocybe salicacicola]